MIEVELSRQDVERATKTALIDCSPRTGVALVVEREADGGVDDARLTGYEDFFPISMVTQEKLTVLPGGDWTTIPRFRQEAQDHDGLYRSYRTTWVE